MMEHRNDLTPEVNVALIERVMEQIDAHPDLWNQAHWRAQTACGTAYCFAGWAVTLDGAVWDEETDLIRMDGRATSVGHRAQRTLGLTNRESDALFDANNDRERLGYVVEKILRRAVTGFEQEIEGFEYDEQWMALDDVPCCDWCESQAFDDTYEAAL